ncbi:MAG: saccharopine dehydrogenase NADP-binding domain-containing protein [Ignavibacteria bacterium]|nr:saccharopine dehydrogenase NADP-binding domain-containing protein [Ignavibacteria bacterium]
MMKITILGTGLVGRTIAKELSNDFVVYAVDCDDNNLKKLNYSNIYTVKADLSSSEEVKRVIAESDLVIGALPGYLGFNALKSVIEAKKNIVDISFFPEDPFLLDELAKKNGVTAVVDCGIAPGLSNLILGYYACRMKLTDYKCLVGGLPYERQFPFEYKAFFSPLDVIEEYKRPARMMINGKLVIKEALSDPELVYFKEVGELEAFNTDGLRTLLQTIAIPNMIEKTLRYPGHIKLMKVFREVGFFDDKEIEINGKKIKPIEFTAKLLLPFWSAKEGERDFTVMEVTLIGYENNSKSTIKYYLFDSYDLIENDSSMARTTGFTCCALARFLINGNFSRKGIIPPELLGESEECFYFVLDFLKNKNVNINFSKY